MSAKISKLLIAVALLSPFGSIASMAQGHFDASKKAQTQGDTLTTPIVDSLLTGEKDSLTTTLTPTPQKHKEKRDWNTWRPNPKRAMWLAIVLPGAGQIYNRKYWKLPLVYGGFVGCIYAMQWNNMMFRDYSKAYQDIMDTDPTTQSYNQFLHLGTKITDENKAQYQSIFKSRKDRYRRWRDLSFFCLLGVYALSIVDAYVDASLSEFDISDDLTLRVEPAVMNSPATGMAFRPSAIGLHCSLTF
ncbi:DUF5683 domain-containing protein [Hoylesella loescheii]|uniref:DUF5683 domain-containing protein n=1 Tax=Hoylesella loescheii TaxID=840 RepID=UPI0028EB55A9|nr:DUF5683 domain-containing protein [Hoylesella loescheii]